MAKKSLIRRLFSFSLRTLFVLAVLTCGAFAYVGETVQTYEREARLLTEIPGMRMHNDIFMDVG